MTAELLERNRELFTAEQCNRLEDQLECLMKKIENGSADEKPFEVIIEELAELQEKNQLNVDQLIDKVNSVERDVSERSTSSVELLIEQAFRDRGVDVKNVKALCHRAESCSLHVLRKIFARASKFSEKSVGDYFKNLNDSELSCDLKEKLLIKFSKTYDNFEDASEELFFSRIQELFKQKRLADDAIKNFFEISELVEKVGWTMNHFYDIVASIFSKIEHKTADSTLKKIINSLEVIFDFSIKPADLIPSVQHCLDYGNDDEKLQRLEKAIHEVGLSQFGQTHENSSNELIKEILSINFQHVEALQELREDFNQTLNAAKAYSNLVGKQVNEYNQADIKLWVENFRALDRGGRPSKAERIAVVARAFGVFKNLKIRDAQILSILMLYQNRKGTLAQINTGEGKTANVAILSVLFCLEGRKVDVGKNYIKLFNFFYLKHFSICFLFH